jgi:hypothetical protein
VARYEALRDRLPSLYRPEDDETAEDLVPLGAGALVEVRAGTASLQHEVRVRSGVLHVLLAAPAAVDGLRLAGGIAPGGGYAAELYRFAEPLVTESRPAVVAAVSDGVAVLPRPLETRRFALALKRRELVTGVLLTVAAALDRLNDEAAEVMQAHWYRYADSGRFSPYVLRARARAAAPDPAPVPAPSDPDVAGFPYIADLGRLASLLSLPPWRAQSAETVETYRERIGRIVSLYRNGLGTLDALRRMTEAQLPVDATAPPERRDRPFAVEDLAALVTTRLPVLMPGEPDSVVGPLMHWRTQGDTLEPAPPTAYVQAPTGSERVAAAQAGVHYAPAAERPVLERFDRTAAAPAVGLAFLDTVPDGATLRLRPAYASWLAREDGVHAARSEPGEDVPADPAAPGPWTREGDGPDAAVAALVQTADLILWAAAGPELWRRDGGGWTQALDAGAAIHALAEDGEDLLLGTEDGLLRVGRHPAPGAALAAAPDPSLAGPVLALLRAADGTWWAGTPDGLARAQGGAFAPFVLEGDLATPVHALAEDASGALYVGTDLGLFQHQPGVDRWYWYAGAEATDQEPEWQELHPAAAGPERNAPTEEAVHLPAVTAVLRARDGDLWIGTAAGLARYTAVASEGKLDHRTLLHAFPDVVPGRVAAIEEDPRGLVWFATDRGLLRYDGRDFEQFRAGAWEGLGRAGLLYGGEPRARGMWRHRRADAVWERFDEAADWVPFEDAPRSAEEPSVAALAFTDGVVADLLDAWDIETFVTGPSVMPVDPALLAVRYKPPGYRRIVDGGIPALPRIAPGEGSWRYLALEGEDADAPGSRPAWTIEGRLLPNGIVEPADAEPDPGRWDAAVPDPDAGQFGAAVFAYPPAARVGLEWAGRRRLCVLVRLRRRSAGEAIDPEVLDRVWEGMRQVRPAAVRVALAVEETVVRKET